MVAVGGWGQFIVSSVGVSRGPKTAGWRGGGGWCFGGGGLWWVGCGGWVVVGGGRAASRLGWGSSLGERLRRWGAVGLGLGVEEVSPHVDSGGADQDDEDAGKDEEDQWKDHLDGGLGRLLLRDLSTFGPHRIRLDP